MGARGYNIAEEGHVVSLLGAENISGGVASQVFTLRDAAKCNIILGFGAESAAPGTLQLFAGTDSTMATSLPILFDLYRQETNGSNFDTLAPRLPVPAAGYALPGTPNTYYILHVQADQLPHEYPWLQLRIADGANTDLAAAFAVLTGLRYAGANQPSATV